MCPQSHPLHLTKFIVKLRRLWMTEKDSVYREGTQEMKQEVLRLTQVQANRWREFNMREFHKQNIEEKRVDNEIQCGPKDELKIKCQLLSHAQLFCDSMGCSPPGSSVPGIFQARILGWVTISFSRRSSQPRDLTWVSCIAGRLSTI